MEENNKYCEQTTRNHQASTKYSTCLHPIETLLEKEGLKKCKKLFNENHIVLNLDQAEITQGKGQQDCTCDFVFGLSKNGRDPKMALTECKFNLKGKKGFDSNFKNEILKKIDSSKNLIGHEIPFVDKNVVLIENNLYNRSKVDLDMLFRYSKTKVIPLNVSLLYETFFR